jgi:hypothetical protein
LPVGIQGDSVVVIIGDDDVPTERGRRVNHGAVMDNV